MHRPGLYRSANFVWLLCTCGREICMCSTPSKFSSHLQCLLFQSHRPTVSAIYSRTRYVANTIALSRPTTTFFIAFHSALQAPGSRTSINHWEEAKFRYVCLLVYYFPSWHVAPSFIWEGTIAAMPKDVHGSCQVWLRELCLSNGKPAISCLLIWFTVLSAGPVTVRPVLINGAIAA